MYIVDIEHRAIKFIHISIKCLIYNRVQLYGKMNMSNGQKIYIKHINHTLNCSREFLDLHLMKMKISKWL